MFERKARPPRVPRVAAACPHCTLPHKRACGESAFHPPRAPAKTLVVSRIRIPWSSIYAAQTSMTALASDSKSQGFLTMMKGVQGERASEQENSANSEPVASGNSSSKSKSE